MLWHQLAIKTSENNFVTGAIECYNSILRDYKLDMVAFLQRTCLIWRVSYSNKLFQVP